MAKILPNHLLSWKRLSGKRHDMMTPCTQVKVKVVGIYEGHQLTVTWTGCCFVCLFTIDTIQHFVVVVE